MKKTVYDAQVKKLMLFRLLIQVIQFKKLTIIYKLTKLKKIPDRDKYITTLEFNKLTAESFTARLNQAKLAA